MKRTAIFFMYVILAFSCRAQVNIMLYSLQGLELRPSDIFRANIQNLTNASVKIYLTGNIVNTTTGEQVVSARSRTIDVQPGLTSLTESFVAPEYAIYSSVVNQAGVLPYGNYKVCLYGYKTTGLEDIGSDCQQVEVVPLSPPLLLSPENQSSVTEQYPMLVWLPPMPIGKDKVLYDLKLVEMQPNQTPYDAIQRNFAIVEKLDYSNTSLQYPANAMKLEEGKKYAWKIVAKSKEGRPLGETEVWWFTKKSIIDPNKEKDPPTADNYYIIMDDNANKGKVIVKEKLKIVSYDYTTSSDLKYKIVDQKGKEVSPDDIELIAEGSGKFVINFTNPRKLYGQTYKLTVTSLKGRNKFIVFDFLKP